MYSDLEWLAFTLVFFKLHKMYYKFKKIQYLDKKWENKAATIMFWTGLWVAMVVRVRYWFRNGWLPLLFWKLHRNKAPCRLSFTLVSLLFLQKPV